MSDINGGVSKTAYYYSEFGNFLESDNFALHGSNIGYKGENLTISFLSLNRSELSIRLLNSISDHLWDFQGEILIIDNGSDTAELEKLETACSAFPLKVRIVKLDKNYGVAGGRNRTIEHVNTEWVLFLDNDIYFINNPLKTMCEEISQLGCHFMNVPLLDPDHQTVFALGGHLYIDNLRGNINVGGGTCYKQIDYKSFSETVDKPFISTFLFGGASILKKKTFANVGMFDENMFIGFEDIDLSIRLFREGYKVGNSRMLSLVHDHPKPANNADSDYEKKRFSSTVIEKSAKYLEQKYGYKIWDDYLINWLAEKNGGPATEVASTQTDGIQRKKPRIALITDVDYWAFGNIARQIEKNLSDRFDFDLISFQDSDWDAAKVLFKAHDADVLHFFWREMTTQILDESRYDNILKPLRIPFQFFLDEFFHNKILSTSVYDHLFLTRNEIADRQSMFNTFNYYVCSNKLDEIYKSISGYPDPLMVIEDGVDPELFYPVNVDRLTDRHRPLIVGWVGNSAWAAEKEDFKGFHTLVKPAVEQLKQQGLEVEGVYCDRVDGFVPHEEMVNYYRKIDVLICMSKIEGTPNPVLEAMACGVPIITTDVGIVPQVFGPKQKDFFVERTIDDLQSKIIELINKRSKLFELSNENLEYIQPWYWPNQCKKFEKYFEKLLDRE